MHNEGLSGSESRRPDTRVSLGRSGHKNLSEGGRGREGVTGSQTLLRIMANTRGLCCTLPCLGVWLGAISHTLPLPPSLPAPFTLFFSLCRGGVGVVGSRCDSPPSDPSFSRSVVGVGCRGGGRGSRCRSRIPMTSFISLSPPSFISRSLCDHDDVQFGRDLFRQK